MMHFISFVFIYFEAIDMKILKVLFYLFFRCCAGKGCGRKFHLPCVDPPLTYFPLGAWYCIWCVKKKIELGVHAVCKGVESILDSRVVDCEIEGIGHVHIILFHVSWFSIFCKHINSALL